MPRTTKKRWLWLAALVMMLCAVYSALGILQALSLYQGERVLANLRLWGSTVSLSLIAAVVCIVFASRSGKPPRDAIR